VRVSHCGNNHLLCLSNDEVALLVDLCHAGAFSDHLPKGREQQTRIKRFLGDVQTSLLKTAQQSASSSHPRAITKTLG
jgi:hypothetical protein